MSKTLNLYFPELDDIEDGSIYADNLDDDVGEGDFLVLRNLGVFLIVHVDGDDAVVLHSARWHGEIPHG